MKKITLKSKFFFIIGSLVVLLAIELISIVFIRDTLNAGRALQGAEATWAKAQRDAVYRLNLYGYTQDEEEYKLYLEKIAIPLAFHKARVALTEADVAKEYLREGQVSPTEVDGIINFFRRFQNFSGVKKAIVSWVQGDEYLEQMEKVGMELHKKIDIKGEVSGTEINNILDKIYSINENLNVMEDNLSVNIRDGIDDISQLFILLLCAVAVTVWFIVVIVVYYIYKTVDKSIKQNMRLLKAKSDADEAFHKERERAESAEIARKVGEQFLANMSHEIRTPMNAIVGFTDVLMKSDLTADQMQCTDAIKTSGDNLLVIINDILDFSRMHSGKLPIEEKDFRLSGIISNCIELMLPKAMEKGLQLSSTIDKNVPNNLVGDPTRLTQVLINLVSNSLKFTEKGQVSIAVRKSGNKNNEVELEFSVRDTGIGIAEEKQASIFDAFTQADNATARKYGGTGLGLAIVRQLADLQGGSVSLTSKLGQGSCFYFKIPYKLNSHVVPAPIPVRKKETEFELRKENSFTIKDIHLLVVEDNAINQLLIKKVISKWGWRMELAENGLIAIQKMEKYDFDAVLMDIQLPEMNGYDATLFIRNRMAPPKRNIPIIAMTANVMAIEEERCYTAGMNDYLSKPFDSQVLYTKVVTLLNKKNAFAN